MSIRLQAVLLLAFLLIAGTLTIELFRPPAPAPASAPPADFSAYRALEHLKQFARQPHPMGTAEHDRVRDYLVAQLRGLGLEPQVQRGTGVTQKFSAAGEVENIVARLKGTRSSGALMLAAHYDSVPAAPGNGDDGAGVAAILETLRALRMGPALQNDLIILFTDGEEDGLLGASAFMAEHPWAKDVRLTLNFEGRGNAGVSQMFETSAGNGRLIREFAGTAPHPFGSSLTYEIYKHMPNDTDMTVFKQHGSAGLNFAFIGHWEAYHAPIDTPENLDPGSLQQHGEYALSLTRDFGNEDLGSLSGRDDVYFSFLGSGFADYPTFLIGPLAALALVLVGVGFVRMLRRGRIRMKKFLLALLALFLLTALLPAGGFALSSLLHWLHRRVLPDGPVFQSVPYWLSVIALLAAFWTAAFLWLSRRLAAANLAQAAAFLLLVLSLVTSRWLPGGSFLAVWPLLALLAAIQVAWRSEAARPSAVQIALLSLLALPALAILAPNLRGLFDTLGLTTPGTPAIALALALLLVALVPQIETISEAFGGKLALSVLVVGVVLFTWGALATRYSAARPKAAILYYALDADSGRALWASSASRNDSWTAQFVGASPASGKLAGFLPEWFPTELLQGEAPRLPLLPPEATLTEQSSQGDSRSLTLRIRPAPGVRSLSVRIPDNTVLESSVNGRPLPRPARARWNPSGKWTLSFANPGAQGMELKLRVQGTGPLKLDVVTWTPGLPDIPGKHFDPRPPELMTVHTGDQTLVRCAFVF